MITWIGASLGDYVIESLLGEGSYSWVYSCLGSGNEQRAIKAAKPEDVVSQGVAATRTFPTQALLQVTGGVLSVQPDAGELLQAQIAKLQAVRAQGLPRVLEFSLQSGLSYYVMDIVRGKTLRQLMQEGPLAIDVFISIAQTLQALQQDPAFLFHGDLKPENIMVQGQNVVILDPGYFGPVKTSRGAQSDVAVTTPAYYPSLQPDDAHALSLILWEAATGEHPLAVSGGGDGTIDIARHGPNLDQYIRGCQAVGRGRFINGLLSLQPPSLSAHNTDQRIDDALENKLLGLMQLTITPEKKLERTGVGCSVGAIVDALRWFKDKGKKILDLTVLSVITGFLLLNTPAGAESPATPPLKVIAPDLVVESLEFGKFPEGKSPFEVSPEHVKFIPVPSGIASQGGCEYGYRIKLRTTRDKVRIYKTFNTPKPLYPKKGAGVSVKPVNDGEIYACWHLDGFENGKYWVKVWVEDKELPTLNYQLKY